MEKHLKTKLTELSKHFEIKSSQQAIWEEYTKLIEMLSELHLKKRSNKDTDAATISPYQNETTTTYQKILSRIAKATSKLLKELTKDQQRILHLLNFELVMLPFRQQMQH